MANTPTDSEAAQDAQTELKRRARRRLVGAAALALLAAIVLPMVMDHEPRPPAQDIQVRIPSQDGTGFASRINPAKPPTPLPPVESKPAPAEPDKPAEAKPEAPVKPEAKPAEAKSAETKPEAKPQPKVEAKPEPKAEAKPQPKPEAKPAAKPEPAAKPAPAPPTKKEEARAAAALEGGAKAEQWVVQLGAYKDAANVKLLTAKLKQMGVPSYTEPFDSPQGPRTRVRAGPFATKEAAEKAQAKAKAIGVTGPVAPK